MSKRLQSIWRRWDFNRKNKSMKYTFFQKKSYYRRGLFIDQNRRRTVDDTNRKIASNRFLSLSWCMRLFINNRIQWIISEVWKIHEFWSDCMLVMWIALIWWIVWLIIKNHRSDIKLQAKIFFFSLSILFISLYSYLWQNKEKTIQRIKKLMRISEH